MLPEMVTGNAKKYIIQYFQYINLIVGREKNSLCITVDITQKNSFTDKKNDILENCPP